jgi:hypothetical protein
MPQSEAAVYLVLCVVADRHGVSYYHPATLGKLVKHPESRVREALETLAQRDLIATAGRFVQVLPLDCARPAPGQSRKAPGPGSSATPARLPEGANTPAAAPPEEVPPPELSGTQRLSGLSDERREYWRGLAGAEFARFLGKRVPGEAMLDSLAADMAHRQGEL